MYSLFPITSLAALFLLFALFLSPACNSDTPGAKKNLKGRYQGTVTMVQESFYSLPDGSDSVYTNTYTFEDHVKLKKGKGSTYEIEEWDSGCDFNICCIPTVCPGDQIFVPENYRLNSNWSYDFVNDLKITFDPQNDDIEVVYFYSDGYFTDVYNEDTFEFLYAEMHTSTYTFRGQR